MAANQDAQTQTTPAEPQVFAVVRTGGKQYRVTKGMKLRVEKLDVEAGSTVTLSDVLMAGHVGGTDVKVAAGSSPVGATVTARVLGEVKEKKVIIFKKRKNGGYTKKQGHRQQKSEIVIEEVAL
jgi:large subunit ribosomal protein L21